MLYYELVHNLVLELTRVGIENATSRCGSSRCRAGWTSTSGARGRWKASCSSGRAPDPPASRQQPRPRRTIALFHHRRSAARQRLRPGIGRRCPHRRRRPEPVSEEPRVNRARPAGAGADAADAAAAAGARLAKAWQHRRRGRNRLAGDSATPPHGDPTADAALDDDADSDSRGRDDRRYPARRRAGTLSAVKLAIVVQRYGADINGGAELHARYVAEHLSRHAEVEVLTTCARDYVTWRDEYPAGTETINGVPVHRFRVDHERDVRVFARWSEQVFDHPHSYLDELKWLDAEGPKSTSLLSHLRSADARLRLRAFLQLPLLPLVSRGERAAVARDSRARRRNATKPIGLALSPRIFRGVRALMYNSPEERRLIQAVSNNHDVPGVVVGIGSEIPDSARSRSGSGRSTESTAASRCTSGESIRTRAARSCSRFS